MSRPGSAVFIFESLTSVTPLDKLFLYHLKPDSAETGALSFVVSDLHCSLRSNRTGHLILIVFFSGNFEYAQPEAYGYFLKKLTDLGKTYGARFVFLTTHDGQLEDIWLENEIICPILAGGQIEETRIGSKVILLPTQKSDSSAVIESQT